MWRFGILADSGGRGQKRAVRGGAQPDHTSKTETETHDIYLTPPGEDVETCQSWIRMRNRDGRYNLMFEEWVTDGPFIISPRITFEARHLPAGHRAQGRRDVAMAGEPLAAPLGRGGDAVRRG